MILSTLLAFFACIVPIVAETYEISACAIFQNEAPYIREWIEYHKRIGIEHFWLYNNNSTDDYKDKLESYIQQGLVTLIEWPSVQEGNDFNNFSFTVQPRAYSDAINRSKGVTKWLMIIDTDEFLVPIEGPLKSLLKRYKKHDAIGVWWACFGTSGVDKCGEGEMLFSLTLRLPLNHPGNGWHKSIVKPHKVLTCTNPHFCILKSGKNTMTVPRETARLNHYWARDEDFLQNVKVPRYEKWGGKREDILNRAEEMNQIHDEEIWRFL